MNTDLVQAHQFQLDRRRQGMRERERERGRDRNRDSQTRRERKRDIQRQIEKKRERNREPGLSGIKIEQTMSWQQEMLRFKATVCSVVSHPG